VPEKVLISIVDDDEAAREGTADLIRAMGFLAKSFTSANDFLKSDDLRSTACLIADMRMPGLTGLELHSVLTESGRVIPTILMTAFPNDRDRAHALRAGVTCYLAKPTNEQDLITCVHSALENRGLN